MKDGEKEGEGVKVRKRETNRGGGIYRGREGEPERKTMGERECITRDY